MNAAVHRRHIFTGPRPYGRASWWCGREGFLTCEELVEKTEEGIRAYCRNQPLKARQAFLGGRNVCPPWTLKQEPTKESSTDDNGTETEDQAGALAAQA